MSSRSSSPLGRAALAASLLCGPVGPAAAGSKGPLPLSKAEQAAVDRARAGASRKLQEPECQKVLEDFRDREGRSLRQSLEQWRVSAAEYVHMIPFVRGSTRSVCLERAAMLGSSVGLPRVYVCSRFAMTQVSQPDLAEALVIHELLHTLGLRENPPTSLEITRRVQERCR